MKLIKIVMMVVVLGTLVVLGLFIYREQSKATLTVRLEGSYDLLSTDVFIDENLQYPTGQGGTIFTTKVAPGKHRIRVVSPGFESFIADEQLSQREEKTIAVSLKKIPPSKIAEEIYSSAKGVALTGARLFGNDDWIVFFAGNSDGSGEGSIVVARYDSQNKSWIKVEEGTDIGTRSAQFTEAPRSLIEYLENR